MKLIIDIPDEKYDWIMSHLTLDRNFRECKITPLPKGHGRLIDADKLANEIFVVDSYSEEPVIEQINEAPTIIEADEGE